MTRHDVISKVNWTRVGVIVGAIGALWLLVTAAGDALDGRYVNWRAYITDHAKRDSIAGANAVRDSVFQADVRRALRISP